MATIGLYHPFIHFKNDDWLKLSALYWGRMARIVPPSYWGDQGTTVLAEDSDVTRALISELEYVVKAIAGGHQAAAERAALSYFAGTGLLMQRALGG